MIPAGRVEVKYPVRCEKTGGMAYHLVSRPDGEVPAVHRRDVLLLAG
jgi:hypothetical protein